jgi:Do/DeqQ family serine protease
MTLLQFGGATLGLVALPLSALAQLPDKPGDPAVPSLAPMIKKASPAVVNIAVSGVMRDQGGRNPLLDDPFFRRFFDVPDQGGPRERKFQSVGSGVIVDSKNGYVLTNAHVVENAKDITVTLLDNRSIKAELVGADKGSDIAVLKIKAPNLTEMPMADSSKAEVGDYVVAIGNPFGLQHTVTFGIISALGRASPERTADSYEDFIQTDAAINPGNSGGALVNFLGQLIGINSQIISQSGGNIGIGFAIPSNMAKSIMDQIVKYGSVKRGMIGIRMQTLSPEVTQSLGVPNGTTGVLVSEVVKGSPAEKAGIEAGDIVTAVNGKAVKSDLELRNIVGLMRIGDKLDVALLRDGKPRHVTVSVGERDQNTAANAEEIHHGLEGADLADAPNAGGVIVRTVAQGSAAADNGLRPNDIIVAIGRKRVANLAELRKAVEGANAFAVTIRRGNSTIVGVIN